MPREASRGEEAWGCVPFTATQLMHQNAEWEKRWLDIADHMHAWQSSILLPLMQKIRDRVEKRVDRAGWPTRGETVEEC